MKTRKVKRLIWAIDPFQNERPDAETAEEFGKFAQSHEISIEPVFVYTPSALVDELAREEAVGLIKKYFKDLKVEVNEPTVLVNISSSLTCAVTILLNHAREMDADLIAVLPRGGVQIVKFIFGSFADNLLSQSRLPILVFNRSAKGKLRNLNTALWTTDFSEESNKAFECFLAQFGNLFEKVYLGHDLSFPLELGAFTSAWGGVAPPINLFIDDQKKYAEEKLSELRKIAQEKGISVIQILTEAHATVAQSILQMAESHSVGIIAMASYKVGFARLVFGSEARKVLRESQFPILIYGPNVLNADVSAPRYTGPCV